MWGEGPGGIKAKLMKKTQKKRTVKKSQPGRKKTVRVRKTPVRIRQVRARRPADSARSLALFCADLLKSKRAHDISIINVSKQIQITDYFVICSGSNKKQNQALAYNFIDNAAKLAQFGCSKPGYSSLQGYDEGQWIVVDLGAVVVHIFAEQLRKYYDLDFLWASAPKVRR